MNIWEFQQLAESPAVLFEGMPFADGRGVFAVDADQVFAAWMSRTFGDAAPVLEERLPMESVGQAPDHHRYIYPRRVSGVIIRFYVGR